MGYLSLGDVAGGCKLHSQHPLHSAGKGLSWVGFLSPGDVAGGCKLLRNRYESRDREWATYTCVLGFHVYGEQGSRGVESCGGMGGQGGVCPGLGMLGVKKPAGPAQEGPSGRRPSLGRIVWNVAGGWPRLTEHQKR